MLRDLAEHAEESEAASLICEGANVNLKTDCCRIVTQVLYTLLITKS